MLNTKRCNLRLMIQEDVKAIHKLHVLEEVDRYNTLGIPESLEATANVLSSWIKKIDDREFHGFIIENKITKEFIGIIGLQLGNSKFKRGEVWYKLMPEQWRKGIGTEVTQEIIRFGFAKLNLHRIEAGCACDNIGSIRVLEKSGFVREGRKRKVLPLKSGWSDGYDYGLLREEWQVNTIKKSADK